MKPRLTGPITGGRRGWAFGAAAFDLDALGYVEEEWFLEGEAVCYRHVAGTDRSFDGRWQAEPASTVPYKTRLLVRRPADPAAFNGTVIGFWTNVSLGFEIVTGESLELYRGFAFVGIMAQSVAIDGYSGAPERGVAGWDPERYGSLSIPTDNASYDIFTQAFKVIGPRRKGSSDPLGGLKVTKAVAFGASQSAGRLATYLNAVQPLKEVVDGFLIDVYFGNGAPLEAVETGLPGITHVEQINDMMRSGGPSAGQHLLRDDLPVKVFVVNSETESLAHHPVRQPDTENYRFWELAGHAHGTVPQREGLKTTWERDLGLTSHPLAPESGYNTLSLEPARSAALSHMHEWVQHGTPPPAQPLIEIEGSPPKVVRDERGNALGGARMPYFAVPTARHSGFRPDESVDLFGSTVPFSSETLHSLYPDHASYVSRFAKATDDALGSGLLLAGHAETLRRQAENDPVPSSSSAVSGAASGSPRDGKNPPGAPMRIVPKRSFVPIDDLWARTANPKHRDMLENFRTHMRAEILNDLDVIMENMAPHPSFHNRTGIRGATHPTGTEQVRELYKSMGDNGTNIFEMATERLAVDDWGIAGEGFIHIITPGSTMVAQGREVDDKDAYYLVSTRMAYFCPYEDGLLSGVDTYQDTENAIVTKLDPSEVIRTENAFG